MNENYWSLGAVYSTSSSRTSIYIGDNFSTTTGTEPMNVFEFIVVYVGINVQTAEGVLEKNKGAVVIDNGFVVAKNAERARSIVSATKIPADWIDKIDGIQVMVQDRGALT